jgi:hypothetical protein
MNQSKRPVSFGALHRVYGPTIARRDRGGRERSSPQSSEPRRRKPTNTSADECVDRLESIRDGSIGHDAALLQEALELARIMATAYRTAKGNDGRT